MELPSNDRTEYPPKQVDGQGPYREEQRTQQQCCFLPGLSWNGNDRIYPFTNEPRSWYLYERDSNLAATTTASNGNSSSNGNIVPIRLPSFPYPAAAVVVTTTEGGSRDGVVDGCDRPTDEERHLLMLLYQGRRQGQSHGANGDPVQPTGEALPPLPTSEPPTIEPCTQSTDALLARELNRLSLMERERVFAEIHGVGQGVDPTGGGMIEDHDYVGRLIAEMKEEIQNKVSNATKQAYERARFLDAARIDDPVFLLRFLRADDYDAKLAAHRLVGFFEFKLALFGVDRLTKDIELEDLYDNPSDKETLESGLFQVLPGRDQSGRPVVLKFHDPKFANLPLNSRLRVFFYQTMAATENDKDHQRGLVILMFNFSVEDAPRNEAWKNCCLLRSLPVRVAAFHICHNGDPKIKALTSLGILSMGPFARLHCRVHEGTLMECIYKLRAFGISSEQLPVRVKSGAPIDGHALFAWIRHRESKEGLKVDSTIERLVDTSARSNPEWNPRSAAPGEFDVVFGRGKMSLSHPGNVRFRQIVYSKMDEYESAKSVHKTLIAESVVQSIKNLPGKFVRQGGSGGWEEVDDETARDKVAHAFRDKRRKVAASH